MSMVQDLIAAVMSAERRIDDQSAHLRGYQQQLDQITEQVQAALAGSSSDYNQQMLAQLAQTRQQVSTTLGLLQTAKDKLERVRMI